MDTTLVAIKHSHYIEGLFIFLYLDIGIFVLPYKQSVICDANRAEIFDALKIKTALAIPASSHSSLSPAFIICFYSMVRADSSPVILKFLQQAIRLVWEGLEKLVPSSDCSDALLWNDIQPSDLGEMAADREMQDTFFSRKKRVLSYTDLSSQFVHESDNNLHFSRRYF